MSTVTKENQRTEAMNDTVVLFTSLGVGHLAPTTELAKLILRHGFAADIIFLEPPTPSSAISSFISDASAAHPSISFHIIPASSVNISPLSPDTPIMKMFSLIASSNPNLLEVIRSIRKPVRALVTDFFCTDALDVAVELGIPSYILFTSSVSCLSTFLYLKTLKAQLHNSIVKIPGLPPIPISHLPNELNKEDEMYELFTQRFSRFSDADGILVNSFTALEPEAMKAVAGGLSVEHGRRMNPVHCIGPIIMETKASPERHECLRWLDSQLEKSVVFLCFGSMGSHTAEQMKEIAVGLERSGQRFLWVVRSPLDKDGKQFRVPVGEPDLAVLLPERFVEKTVDRGMVVKSWAPQVEVLRHVATGGFVTHCGWNSTLEAVAAGVPMIGWPLYAEQKMNLVLLTEEMKLAVAMNGYNEGIVSAAEVEEKVTWLMTSEGGRELRERSAVTKAAAKAAVEEGGLSYEALAAVVSHWK